MSDKYSCINLGVISATNNIISFILRNVGMKQYGPVIKFRDFGFFPITVNLDLFGVNFGSTPKPSLCNP